mmetsp:Transcript_31659/g.66584  ORF Transcript_31659/g.66584 Transcript_31659/m.66584 type:complete len:609 (-) Transcript_31659:263-2089(-)|eukprot:CAMPEP_0172301944 /NCGR_PEP_ID=MMETSP1058-20130122/3746_1 /TAXON_ID=83371 /ORGANISM="Detonula confervacea, Strain CCMP 353" /LENGTH=608 /DNA_ID=CAMNT_0013012265 /DNA_START=53 /DNA_END=1879 /DNA_ORIENTATION=+
MGKKKPFIDKKTASVFHVVRRSQRDVGTEATAENLSDFVLMPSPENAAKESTARKQVEMAAAAAASAAAGGEGAVNKEEAHGTTKRNNKMDFDALKSQIAAAGLLDETASTYTQYTKPIERGGTFVPTTSEYLPAEDVSNFNDFFTDTTKNTLDTALEEAMAVHEVGRMLDSIALNADCMEDDMANALFEFEDGEYEEILDDFCLTANQEELEGDDGEDDGEFNFEQHVQRLMEKARAQENGCEEGGRALEDNFFGGVTPLHGQIEEEDDEDDFDYDQYGEDEEDSLDREFDGEDGSSKPQPAVISDAQQRVLCQKFEDALLEYDSDDVGDLDEECEEIGGARPLEGDMQLEAALNEFLTEKEDDILIEGTNKDVKRTGGSGYSALVGKKLFNASELGVDASQALLVNIEESKKQMQKDLADADAVLANPEMDLPPEEVFIDGKSYFTATSRNPWDCESILSTYSNLDNNPAVIGRRKKKKGGKKNKDVTHNDYVIPEDGPVNKIQLSNKTGLPMGTFDNLNNQSPEDEYDYYDGEDDTYLSINQGEARKKDETKMEKKQRKLAVKDERKICRMQKKIMKEAFKEEFQKRGDANVVDAVGGNTVFRFS